MSTLKLTIDSLVAAGTLAVAVMAIFGEKVRACLAPLKLRIEAHNLHGRRWEPRVDCRSRARVAVEWRRCGGYRAGLPGAWADGAHDARGVRCHA